MQNNRLHLIPSVKNSVLSYRTLKLRQPALLPATQMMQLIAYITSLSSKLTILEFTVPQYNTLQKNFSFLKQTERLHEVKCLMQSLLIILSYLLTRIQSIKTLLYLIRNSYGFFTIAFKIQMLYNRNCLIIDYENTKCIISRKQNIRRLINVFPNIL